MALSDCNKCWQTPCECGWEYKDMPPDKFAELIAGQLSYKKKIERIKILSRAIELIALIPEKK